MEELIFEAIVGVLGADTAFLITFLAHLSSKYQQSIQERGELLDKKLTTKIDGLKTSEITIEKLLPLFREYGIIENWKNVLPLISFYFCVSMFFAFVGLVSCLLGYAVIEYVPVAVLFAIGGVLYFMLGLYALIKHSNEVNKWKVSQKKEKPNS